MIGRSTLVLLSACGLPACSRNAPPQPPLAIVADDASVAEPAEAGTAETAGAGAAIATSTAPSPAKVLPSYCTTDEDCVWDPPCGAQACVARSEQEPSNVVCDNPVPGPCVCAERVCTARRASASTSITCKTDADCGFDAPTGTCTAKGPSSRIAERGGFCACEAGACALHWVDPIPCKTTKECSWLDAPRRPAPASKVPRPRPPVKPCATGEWDSVCQAGHCRIVVWKC